MTAPRNLLTNVLDDTKLAVLAESSPRVPWDVFLQQYFSPMPGEHIGIIGSTGKGKTILQTSINKLFPFVAVFATKAQDDSMDRLIANGGYMKLNAWRDLNPRDFPRRVIWPDASRIDSDKEQQRVFHEAMARIFRQAGKPRGKPTGWALSIDELWFISTYLNLKRDVSTFLYQGRSLGHTAILATQRPFDVNTEVYDQSTHLFFFRFNEERALRRLTELQTDNRQVVRYAVPRLEEFQVLYVHNHTGLMVRTRIPHYLVST